MLENNDFLGAGLKFPVGVNSVTGRFEMTVDEEKIKESIYIILMTQKGERILMPGFGSEINNYVFEVMNETNLNLMANNIKTAIQTYEKRVKNINVEVTIDKFDSGKLVINISYVVSKTNMPGNMVFPFYIQEGETGEERV
ncbi:MAG: GPW/gp25 family protein [Oscillospiraceae bacterium]|nr:GPW/gp25 family protein [Oscillospiraceae bacterium]